MLASNYIEPDSLLAELLSYAVMDYVDIPFLYSIVSDSLPSTTIQRLVVDGLIARVLIEGLMVTGDLNDGFQQWNGQPRDWIERILSALAVANPSDLRPGDIGWLCNTKRGHEVGLRATGTTD